MTLVYLKLLKHATHHLEWSLSRDTWFCTFARANEADGGRLISQGSFRVNEFPRTSLAMESKARRSGDGLQSCFFCCVSMSATRVSYAQIRWWRVFWSHSQLVRGCFGCHTMENMGKKTNPERMGDSGRAGV